MIGRKKFYRFALDKSAQREIDDTIVIDPPIDPPIEFKGEALIERLI